MFSSPYARSQQPLFFLGKVPVHLVTLLVILHVGSLVVNVLTRGQWAAQLTFFFPQTIAESKIWQFATYAFVHDLDFWFLLHMFMFFWFGREVEQYWGRGNFFKLYLLLLLTPPVFLAFVYFVSLGIGSGYSASFTLGESSLLHFCIFLAFAFMYPNVLLLFGLKVKWVATAFFALAVLQYYAAGVGLLLVAFLVSVGVTYWWLRYKGLSSRFGFATEWAQKTRQRARKHHSAKHLRVVKKKQKPKIALRTQLKKESKELRSIDPILDKIAREGISSLTEEEKKILEEARSSLMEKDTPSEK